MQRSFLRETGMKTDVHLGLLDSVRIAAPCTARWEDMAGDERTRLCAQCSLDVHNVSAMTRDEAEAFLRSIVDRGTGRVCMRFYRRVDGTILTADCPVGLAAVRKRASAAVARVGAVVAMLMGGAHSLANGEQGGRAARLRQVQPFAMICAWLAPAAAAPSYLAVPGQMSFMGSVCPPPQTPPPPPPSSPTGPQSP